MSVRRRPLSKSTWKASRNPWHKLRRRPAGALSEAFSLPPEMRLWMLAVSRIGASGHAVFEPGELAELMPKVIRSTGELGSYSEAGMNKLIRHLVEGEALAPSSNSRCLVVPMSLIDVWQTSPVNCPEHRHRMAWMHGGWVGISRRTQRVVAAA